MEDVKRRVAEGKYAEAAKTCERIELETAGEASCQLEWVYSAQIVCHLIAGQVNDARFCWKRVPDTLRENAEIQNVCKVLKTLWEKDYVGFHKNVSAHPWSELLLPLMGQLAAETRSRVQRIITKAYTSISLDALTSMLACTMDEALQVVEKNGWKLDPSSNTIEISDKACEDSSEGSRYIPGTGLEEMTKYVLHLDMQN